MTKNILIKTFCLFVSLITFVSCGSKVDETPESAGIMSKETFTRVLTDFALAESASNMNVLNTDLQKLDSIYNFNPLTDNGVTKAQYDSAVMYYVKHPDLYKQVYEDVLTALTELQTKRNSPKDTTAK